VATVVQNGASFVNRRMRVVMAIFGFTLAAAMLGATAGAHGIGGKVSTAVLAVACLALGLRALVSNSIKVGDRSLLVKSLLRTRSIAYGDVSGAETISRPIGVYQRVCVRLDFKSGSHLDVTTVNESEANRAVIDGAAARINERVEEEAERTH
jgi:hypothetical protein